MIHLSVNINKIATIRNARGGNLPDVTQFAIDCQKFGADGITVHPRPDERHITLNDVHRISGKITTEFNIEGYPDIYNYWAPYFVNTEGSLNTRTSIQSFYSLFCRILM